MNRQIPKEQRMKTAGYLELVQFILGQHERYTAGFSLVELKLHGVRHSQNTCLSQCPFCRVDRDAAERALALSIATDLTESKGEAGTDEIDPREVEGNCTKCGQHVGLDEYGTYLTRRKQYYSECGDCV